MNWTGPLVVKIDLDSIKGDQNLLKEKYYAPRLGFSSKYKLLKVILQSYKIVCKTDSEVFQEFNDI